MVEPDGRPLGFAFRCLLGSWRTMPLHGDGRFTLASYTLSLGLFVPLAAMLTLAVAYGFPFIIASDGIGGFVSDNGTHMSTPSKHIRV